jgi:hypothetical protein
LDWKKKLEFVFDYQGIKKKKMLNWLSLYSLIIKLVGGISLLKVEGIKEKCQ